MGDFVHILARRAPGVIPTYYGGSGTSTTFTQGSIIFAGSGGVYSQDNANLFWDDTANNLGIGTAAPTARLHLPAGTTAASTAPLKFVSGSLNTAAEVGAFEFLTDKFYGVITTGTARKEFTLNDITLTSGRVPYMTTNGRLTDTSTFKFDGSNLGVGGTASLQARLDVSQADDSGTTTGARFYANNRTQYIGITYQRIIATGTLALDSGSSSHTDIIGNDNGNSQRSVSVGNLGGVGQNIGARFAVSGNPANTTSDTGTVDTTINTNTITGSGTNFTTVIGQGYTITIGANIYPVKSVASATSLTIFGLAAATVSGSAWSFTKPTFYAGNYSQTSLYLVNSLGQNLTRDSTSPTIWFDRTSARTWATRIISTNNNRFEIFNDTSSVTPFYIDGTAVDSSFVIDATGDCIVGVNAGIGVTSPTARLHLAAGTTTASTAPIKFNTGPLMTAAEAGAVEFLTDIFYGTITTGAARKEFTLNDAALTSGTFPVATTNGRLTNSALTSTTLTSGTYTPTLTNVANLDASTAYACQYLRVGSVVTVSGKVDIDPTAPATQTRLGISLPIASNMAITANCGGVAFATAIAGQGAAIFGDSTNDRAELQFVSGDITNQPMFFSFTYQII
jgi:hypothetical protein